MDVRPVSELFRTGLDGRRRSEHAGGVGDSGGREDAQVVHREFRPLCLSTVRRVTYRLSTAASHQGHRQNHLRVRIVFGG